MEKTLLVIDSFISDVGRAYYCEKLITQIKKNFQGYKILLINKSGKNFDLEKKVDYYLNFGDSFMVGAPPKEILDSGAYSRPYLFIEISFGILENWMPLTGVTDHVAGIYNSFVIASKFAKSFGFEKVFKFEFDTIFDEDELKKIKSEIESFSDYLIYGRRHEGQWTKFNLVDVHMAGFTPRVFEGFDVVRNDKEFWDLCSKVGYHGKWIEYLLFAIIEKQKKQIGVDGIMIDGHLRNYYPKTQFDVINSPGEWTDRWKDIPAVGRISLDSGKSELTDRLSLFYYNNDFDQISVDCKIYKGNEVVHKYNSKMIKKSWFYDEIKIESDLRVVSEYFSDDGYHKKTEFVISPNKLDELRFRFLKK